MLCYGVKELEVSFRTVRNNTIAIAEDIPADKYDFRATTAVRSVAEMLAHIAMGTRSALDLHGKRIDLYPVDLFMRYLDETRAAEQQLSGKASIVAALKEEGERYASFLASLDDEVLAQRVTFPPPVNASRARLEMLLSVKEHEMHHRSQLMLIERLLGLVPHLTRQREAMRARSEARA